MINLTVFEEALVIARKHHVKNFTMSPEGFVVELNDEPIDISVPDFDPQSDTMMTEQQFNEGDDYLITNPTTMR